MEAVARHMMTYTGSRHISSNSLSVVAKLMDDVLHRANEVAYSELDFPDLYVRMAHPADYKETSEPIEPHFLYHDRPAHFRLLLRASFRLASNLYIPMTFLCDTGVPGGFYFSHDAMTVFTNAKRVMQSDLYHPYIQTCAGSIPVSEAQQLHQPANLLGLHALRKYGLMLAEKPSFAKPFNYF
ncbi:hypothetical protein ABBQ32_007771 [Trebouxia sp. C0010 RCD-2024]